MILCSQKHGQHFCFNQKGCKVTSTQCSRTFNFRFTTMDNIVRYQQTIDHIHPVLLISAASCPNTIPRCTQTYEGPSHADKPNLDPQVHQVAYTCGLQALGTCGIWWATHLCTSSYQSGQFELLILSQSLTGSKLPVHEHIRLLTDVVFYLHYNDTRKLF